MRIGNLVLENPLILAPMARITQLPLRRLAREAGCALVVTEMMSANGLVHRSKKTKALLASHPSERPLAAQIFGSDPAVVREAATMVERSGADILDINLGCSVRKVVRQGAGVALMRDPEKLESILTAVRGAITIPLTVKMRTGWEPSGAQAIRAARVAESCGVDAVIVHPRTATQAFGGSADWSLIARVKEAVGVSVIGNGDILDPDDVLRMQRETGCDGIMIGRSAIGNPWIFTQSLDRMKGRQVLQPDHAMRRDNLLRYVKYAVEHFGEDRAIPMMRSRVGWFIKGLPHSSRLRETMTRLKTEKEVLQVVESYFDRLINDGSVDFVNPLTGRQVTTKTFPEEPG
jgi:nifR3 family TIM-barrel protein